MHTDKQTSSQNYPPDALDVWGRAVAVMDEPAARRWLQSRGLDPVQVAGVDVARVLVVDDTSPQWARDLDAQGYRLIVPLYDADGVMRSLVARTFARNARVKARTPTGFAAKGLAMDAGPRDAREVVVVEGEPDWLTWAAMGPEGARVIGVRSGSWSSAWAASLAPMAYVYLRTDLDDAGQKYADDITMTLGARTAMRLRLDDGRDDNERLMDGELAPDPSAGCEQVRLTRQRELIEARAEAETKAAPCGAGVTRRKATKTSAWGKAALTAEADKLRAMGEGGRGAFCYAAARRLGQLVEGGEIVSDHEVVSELESAAVQAGLERRAARGHIERGLRTGHQDGPRVAPADDRGDDDGDQAEADERHLRVVEVSPEGEAIDNGWQARLQYTADEDNPRLRNTAHNLSLILAYDPRLRGLMSLDVFAQRVIFKREPPWSGHIMADDDVATEGTAARWTDSDTQRLTCWLGEQWGIEPATKRLHAAVVVAAEANATHPVRDYLRDLPAWDGVDRLDHWLVDHLGATDTPYVRAVGRWWLISAVARVQRPGCKVDHMLILEGPQGLGKSSALKALCPDPEWFSDSDIDIGSKDAYIALHGKWIVEMAELDALSKKEASASKAFITSSSDHYRPPYGQMSIDVQRQSVFAGTVNPKRETGYFSDSTGNRRFWPVLTRHVQVDAIVAARDQLWAEALHRFDAGQPWWPQTDEEHAMCSGEQSERLHVDTWAEPIAAWLDGQRRKGVLWVTTAQLLSEAAGVETGRQQPQHQRRLAAVMSDHPEWTYTRRSEGGRRARGYQYEGGETVGEEARDVPF